MINPPPWLFFVCPGRSHRDAAPLLRASASLLTPNPAPRKRLRRGACGDKSAIGHGSCRRSAIPSSNCNCDRNLGRWQA